MDGAGQPPDILGAKPRDYFCHRLETGDDRGTDGLELVHVHQGLG